MEWGPFAPKLLADLGADVIKVNAVYDAFWTGTHMGLGTNRGKRSISLNLKAPEAQDILNRLLATTDVVATNWRPGAAARLGLDYESLHRRFPQIVVCNSRGFESGPRSDLPGTDQTAAALTGMEYEDGACRTGNPPMWSRSNMGDTGNGFLSAIGIVHALTHRERTGQGIEVSTSIVNAGLLATSYAWSSAGAVGIMQSMTMANRAITTPSMLVSTERHHDFGCTRLPTVGYFLPPPATMTGKPPGSCSCPTSLLIS